MKTLESSEMVYNMANDREPPNEVNGKFFECHLKQNVGIVNCIASQSRGDGVCQHEFCLLNLTLTPNRRQMVVIQ